MPDFNQIIEGLQSPACMAVSLSLWEIPDDPMESADEANNDI